MYLLLPFPFFFIMICIPIAVVSLLLIPGTGNELGILRPRRNGEVAQARAGGAGAGEGHVSSRMVRMVRVVALGRGCVHIVRLSSLTRRIRVRMRT